MAEATRSIHVVTADEVFLSSVRSAASALEGWRLLDPETPDDLLASPPALEDIILLDGWMAEQNVYEVCRRLTGNTRCRTWVVPARDARLAEPIALFCGATGVLERPLTTEALRAAIERAVGKRSHPADSRGQAALSGVLPEALLESLSGETSSTRLIDALTDPETSLFSYDYLTYKLDEEFKRAQRFGYPLTCVMLGFDGQAAEEVLQKLASIFLQYSRDTDVLGRFDESSFLFLLPQTGPDGAAVMARRIEEQVEREGLVDLVGDPLVLAVGISTCPHTAVAKREDLFGRAREAFRAAQLEGGGVVQAG